MGRMIADPRAISRRWAAHQAIYTARLVREIETLKRYDDVCRVDDELAS